MWNVGMLLGLAVLVYHLLALWYRWLRPDPEFLAFSASVAELLAIASFIGFQTDRGRVLAEGLGDVHLVRALWGTPPRAFGTVWTATILTGLALYLGSPMAARIYRERGAVALEQGAYSEAIRSFEQAISLDATDARTHFNLASVYEMLHEEEKAISAYQDALELEHDFWPSYNNLGRLLIEARGRPDAALAVLLAGERQAGTNLGRAVIAKNVAWAYLGAGFPNTALSELQRAESLFQDLWANGESVAIYLAETARLEARIQLVLDHEAEEIKAWQDCLGYSLAVAESTACTQTGTQPPPDCLQAQQWVAEARERGTTPEGDTQ
jgi:tetratricopeptide (TPR) repeat protein